MNSLAGFEKQYLAHLRDEFPELLEAIAVSGDISEETETNLTSVTEDFAKDFGAGLAKS